MEWNDPKKWKRKKEKMEDKVENNAKVRGKDNDKMEK